MINSLTLGVDYDCSPDFSKDPWREASLVTPRHVVHEQWNDEAIKQHCVLTGHRHFLSPAEDKINGRPCSRMEQLVIAAQGPKKTQLRRTISLAIGLRVLVTLNINTDLDIANGAKGTIVDIVLHPDEEIDNKNPVELKYIPAYILVRLDQTCATKFPGLDEGVIPIEPALKSFSISYSVKVRNRLTEHTSERILQKTVQRQQFPITGAYAFMDYRSQGQTIKTVIIDLAKPPTGGDLSLFNVYVSLSRSSGRDTVRLL